jgi:hypothetical protein
MDWAENRNGGGDGMNLPRVHIRLILATESGPVGPRLAREMPLPPVAPSFPDTPEGRAEAEEARRLLQAYIDTHHAPKKSK